MKRMTIAMLAIVALNAVADETTVINNITWTYWDYNVPTEMFITGGGFPHGDIVMPSVINGRAVTGVGYRAFWECTAITSMTIPDSIQTIGEYAFYGCSGMKCINIPSNVKTIREYAFMNCTALKKVLVDNGDKDRVRNLYNWGTKVSIVEQVTDDEEDEEEDIKPDLPAELTPNFDESVKHTFNGLVYDSDGAMCGMVQITTGKATKSGVSVGGSVMLANGKKQTLKSTGTISGGYLTAKATVGKIGNLNLTVGGNGFKGTLGNMTLTTADTDEGTGILSGTLKLSYFDAKTGKVKTKSYKLTGITSGGEAVGNVSLKNDVKTFEAVIE